MEEKAARGVAVVLRPRQECGTFIRKNGSRGQLCLAAEFMPKKGKTLCNCEIPLRYEIGYPVHGTTGKVPLPSDTDMAERLLKAISASSELRRKRKEEQES
eukprot:scaffold80904_cov56-Attheya_sp.AAC.4